MNNILLWNAESAGISRNGVRMPMTCAFSLSPNWYMGNRSSDKQWLHASWSFTSFSRKYVFLGIFAYTHLFVAVHLFVCSASDCRRFGRIWMLRANTSHGSIIYDYYFLTSSIKLNSLDNKNGNYLFNFHQRKISIDSRMAFWRILRIQSIGLLLITQHNYYVKMMRWLYWWYRYCVASCYRLSNVVPVGDCERQLIERKW